MLNWRKNKWIKITAIAAILLLLPAQTSFAARGRRGGNSTGDLIVAALSGAAVPVFTQVFNANPYVMVITSAVRYSLIEAGCDPQTTMLVSAAAGGAASGYFNPGANMADTMVKSVVKRIVAAEVTYELSRHEGTRPFAGMAGALSGYLADVTMQAEGDPATITKHLKSDMFRENLMRIAISGGVTSLIRYSLLPSLVGEDSMALRLYGHELASLGGSLAVEGTEELGILPERTTYGVEKRIENFDYKQQGQAEKYEAATNAEDMEQINQYQEGFRDGLVWYDKNKDVVKVVKKEADTYVVYKYKLEAFDEKIAADIKDMSQRGYQFRVDDKNKQLVALYKYDPRPRAIWQDQGREVEVRDEKGKTKYVLQRTIEPKKGETFTFTYNKDLFSNQVKNTQIGVDGIAPVYDPSEQRLQRTLVEVKPGDPAVGGVLLSTENMKFEKMSQDEYLRIKRIIDSARDR